MTITTTLEVITTSLNTITPAGATAPVATLVVGVGAVPASGMTAYASQTFSITAPTSDDITNYTVGKTVTQTIAPASAPASTTTTSTSPSS